jgi:hypothetical protein
MKKNYRFLTLSIMILSISVGKIFGQCLSSSQYGSGTISSNTPGFSLTIAFCAFGGEYSPATFNVTGAFTFSSNVASDYLTIYDATNSTVLAFGNSPLSYSVASTGVYNVHVSTSGPPTCGTGGGCRDLTVHVPLLPCAGIPSAGTLPASFSICPNSVATISLTGATNASGVTYQWQQAPTAGGPWSNVTLGTGFTSQNLTTPSLTALTFYQVIVTCTISAQTATSNAVSVNPNNTFNLCYCNSNLGGSGCGFNFITNVSILSSSFNNTSICNNTPLNGSYSQFAPAVGTTATLNAGANYSVSVTSNQSNIISLWIDYNQNGIFDPAEHTQVATTSTANAAAVAVFNIPGSALGGLTGMRVRTHNTGNPNGPNDACSNFWAGETEDYVVNIVAAAPCAGIPNPGLISTTQSTAVCSGAPVNFVVTGQTIASGLTYQWQTSPNNISWSAVVNATNTSYSQSITAVTYIRLIVACGSNTAVTNVIQFTLNPVTLCYCNTNLGGSGCSGDNITNVTIAGTGLNNNSTCNSNVTNGTYTQFVPGAGTTATLSAGITYTISVTTTANNIESLWIDYNQNGLFDATEHTQLSLTSTPGAPTNAAFTVPLTASLGQTGMRVRSRAQGNPNGPTDACTVFGSGETEDYLITIAAAAGCAGAPGANLAVTSMTNVCPNGNASLSLANSYTVGGLTYQWSTATSSVGPYTSVSGATASAFTATNITAALWYQAVITCTNGGASTTATPVQITVSGNPCQCSSYCASAASSTNDDEIFNVSIGTLNNTSSCSQTGGPGSALNLYSNYSGMIAAPNLVAGASYTFSALVGQCNFNAYSGGVTVYMDYNQNGLFTDLGEQVFVSALTSFAVAGTVVTATINIPATANPGTTRMRVIAVESQTGTASCAAYTWGETEDYCINIIAGAPCTGTPLSNSVIATSTNVCSGTGTGLSLATSYTVGGLSYQWATATSSVGPYTAVSSATLTTFNPTNITVSTWYQAVITCTNGGASTTATPVQILVGGSPCQCLAYCTSSASSTADDEIFNVSFGTLNNSSSCSQTGGVGSILNQYSNYAGIIAAPTIAAGINYNLSVTVGQCSGFAYSGGVTAYIDYNQNGLFTDAGEMVFASPNTLFAVGGTTLTALINIPATATPGTTRLRVIAVESNTLTGSCAFYNWGETEDYCINIVPPTPCSGTPVNNTITPVNSLVCSGSSLTLNFANTYTVGGLSFQWSTSTSSVGPFAAVGGGTNSIFNANNLITSQYYQAIVTCTNSGLTTTISPAFIGILGAPVYANVPFLENFDNVWQNRCDLRNVPVAANWDSNPTTTDDSWRRQDDGISANWFFPTSQTVAPLTGPGCANFHSSQNFSTGDLSLYVNLNLATTYTLSFWYQNPSGFDQLDVSLSNDGGATFTAQANYVNDIVWAQKTILLTGISSPSCVIKFTGSGDFSDDLAIDSLKILTPCTAPNVSVTASSSITCPGSSVTITANGAGTYSWNTAATTSVIVVTPSVSTTYTVNGQNGPGCGDTKTISVSVSATPTVGVNSSQSIICSGSSAILTASGAITYTWSNALNTASITVSPTTATTYTVNGSNANGCQNSKTITVNVNSSPVLVISPNATICTIGGPSSATLIVSGATGYTWSPANFAGNVNSPTVVVSPAASTIYSVVSTNTLGCSTTATVGVTVSSCVGITSYSQLADGVSVYPNPNTGNINVRIDNMISAYTFEVFDLAGKQVYVSDLNKSDTPLNLNEFANGMYNFKITAKNTKLVVKQGKLIKQ